MSGKAKETGEHAAHECLACLAHQAGAGWISREAHKLFWAGFASSDEATVAWDSEAFYVHHPWELSRSLSTALSVPTASPELFVAGTQTLRHALKHELMPTCADQSLTDRDLARALVVLVECLRQDKEQTRREGYERWTNPAELLTLHLLSSAPAATLERWRAPVLLERVWAEARLLLGVYALGASLRSSDATSLEGFLIRDPAVCRLLRDAGLVAPTALAAMRACLWPGWLRDTLLRSHPPLPTGDDELSSSSSGGESCKDWFPRYGWLALEETVAGCRPRLVP